MLLSYSVYVCAFTVAILSAGTAGGKPGTKCRETSIFQNFDLARVVGLWYVYSHHDHDFERGCDCSTSEVTQLDANSLQISHCCQMTIGSNVTQTCTFGVNGLRLANPEKKDASLLMKRAGVTDEIPAWLLDVDYENYLIGLACDRSSGGEERELLWILSRDIEISAAVVKKINSVLNAHNFKSEKIRRQRHGVDICKSRKPGMGHGGRGHHN